MDPFPLSAVKGSEEASSGLCVTRTLRAATRLGAALGRDTKGVGLGSTRDGGLGPHCCRPLGGPGITLSLFILQRESLSPGPPGSDHSRDKADAFPISHPQTPEMQTWNASAPETPQMHDTADFESIFGHPHIQLWDPTGGGEPPV